MKRLIRWFVLSAIPIQCMAQSVHISGYVKDSYAREVLIGATIFNLADSSSTETNEYGYYSLSIKPSDSVRLLFSYIGHQPEMRKFATSVDLRADVFLSAGRQLQEVSVSANRNDDNVNKAQTGAIDIPINAVKGLPALFGERDILKIVQLLPGVQQGQEGTAGFYVRGGNLDQNLILLDEATLYNPNHLFGLFSSFNVNALNGAKLIKGGFPAQYGGRLSSILDITMREGNKKSYHTEAGVGLLSANLTVEGPIQKNKSSFIVSGRHSYINLLLHPLTSNTTSYAFYDLNAKLNYELDARNHLFLSFFKGSDNASYVASNSLDYGIKFGNASGTLCWNHIYGHGIFSNTSLIYNDYHLQLGTTQSNYYEALYTGIRDINLKTAFTAVIGNKNTLRFGASYTYHTLYPGAISAKVPKKGNRVNVSQDSINQQYSKEAALYFGDDYKASTRISLSPGIRVPLFIANKKNYVFLEPRLTAKYSIGEHSSVKASYTQMNQFVHLVPNSTASLPADIWLSSNAYIKPESSHQIAVGFFRNFLDNCIEASVELYYKTMDNQVLFKEGTQLLLNTNIDSQLTFGKGESYGAELMVKKNVGRLTGWISYTLSKTTQQFAALNYGNPFPASFDRRHNLALVASYELTKHWTVSADFVIYSGKPYTLPAGKVIAYSGGSLYDHYYYDYTSRNNSRMAVYNRLDISASNKKNRRIFHKYNFEREWIIGLYNAYSRNNPYFVYLSVNPATKQPQATQVSLLPIIPNISYNIKF